MKKSGPCDNLKGNLKNSNLSHTAVNTFWGDRLFIQFDVVVNTREVKCCKVISSFE